MRWIDKYRRIEKYRRMVNAIIVSIFILVIIIIGRRMENLTNRKCKPDTFTGIAMGTNIKKTIYSESAKQNETVNKAVDQALLELDNQISVRLNDSEISKCNQNHAVDGVYKLSDNLLEAIRQELQISKESGGAFSPCIRPITNLWGIEDGKTEIPEMNRIQNTLQYIDAENIEVTEEGIIFREDGMSIDFGATGKGIACDELVKLLADYDVQGAILSIGGSIAVYGNKGDGKAWHVGIQDPRGDEGEVLGVLDIKENTMISTSGDYEKYFEVDGKRYHHIFDPSTGYPVDNGLISVTIISDSGFLSDVLSTTCFVLGLDKGMKYAEDKGAEAIFVTADKEVYVTKGLQKTFHLQNKSYTLENEKK